MLDWLALTTTERRVILFLATTLLLGTALRLYRSTASGSREYDYRTNDSTFAALSSAPASDSLPRQEQLPKQPGNIALNSATTEELESLPGIGTVIAGRIIQRRNEVGRFKSVEELLKIKGITKKRLEHIKNFITIDIPTPSPREE